MMTKAKKKLLRITAITAFILAMYGAYYILLCNYSFNISSILIYAKHLTSKQHLLILGLLPIYISTIIFGAAILGIYLGSKIEFLIFRKNKTLLKAPSEY